MTTQLRQLIKRGGALMAFIALVHSPAYATRYYYSVEGAEPFFHVLYPNDAQYGGTGRGRFEMDFSPINVTLVADDVTGTVKMSGTMKGTVLPGHENIGPLETLAPGLYAISVDVYGATVRDPRLSNTPFEVVGENTASSGLNGKFTNLDDESLWLHGTGFQSFKGMPYDGVPPSGFPQIANLMFGAQSVGGAAGTFGLDGWVFIGALTGHEPYLGGDFHATLKFTGADGAAVPEPMTLGLLGSALVLGPLARRRKRLAAS